MRGGYRKPLKRPCANPKCGEMFQPNGSHTRLCDKCFYNARSLSVRLRTKKMKALRALKR